MLSYAGGVRYYIETRVTAPIGACASW
jgi:hypothetical protein